MRRECEAYRLEVEVVTTLGQCQEPRGGGLQPKAAEGSRHAARKLAPEVQMPKVDVYHRMLIEHPQSPLQKHPSGTKQLCQQKPIVNVAALWLHTDRRQ